MNKCAKTLVALGAAALLSTSAFASAPDTIPSQRPAPLAKKKAEGASQVAEIYCASIRWPSFKRNNHDVYSTTGAGSDTTYCAVTMGATIFFMWY